MESLTLMASLLLAISFLLAPCASDQLNLQKSLQQVDHARFSQLSLPRKLMNLHEETVKRFADKDSTPDKKLIEPSKDTKQHEKEENVMNAGEKGTWRERVEAEGPNKSEYFTMDYGWVRRRRPIHNKQIPYVP